MPLERPSQKPHDASSGAGSENDLAAELARILARPPRRAVDVHPDGPGVRQPADARDTINHSRPAGVSGPSEAEPADADPTPEDPLPAWARARRSGRIGHNARMVGASVVAVVIVVAIIGGAAVALFGGPRDLAALKQLVLPTAPAADRM